MIPNCSYPESIKCNTCGLNVQAISSSLPASTSSPAQLTIAYDGGSSFHSDGSSAWQLPSSSAASSVSASTRTGAYYLATNRPTPEMPL